MKKKIVIGITAPQSEYLLRGQMAYLSKKYDVYLLAPEAERIEALCAREGATHLPVSIKRQINVVSDFTTLLAIINIFQKVKPDIVNLGTPKVSLLGMIAAQICSVPLRIYTCRGFRYEHEQGYFRKLLIFFERIICLLSHHIICISKSVQNIGVSDKLFDLNKSCVIGHGSSNGVDLSLFNPDRIKSEEIIDLKKIYGINDEFIIGYVGRLIDRKGIKELYYAFDQVYQNNKNIKLFVVGRAYKDQIADMTIIDKYNSHSGIIMAGLQPLENVPLFLSTFNVFVLPAYWEGFGNVLIQASAMGIPILATDVTGCRDAVKDGYTGKLIEAKSVEKLKDGLEEFIGYKDSIIQYGKNGKIWAENFKPEIIWEGMDKIFSDKL